MKKVGYIIATILEILFLIGAYVLNYFTRKKMGMARYVIYKNQGWEKQYPMSLIQTLSIIICIVLTVLIIFLFLKKRTEVKKIVYVMNLVMIVLSFVYTAYVVGSSVETMRSYYFVSLMLMLAAFVQIINTFIGILVCKHEK